MLLHFVQPLSEILKPNNKDLILIRLGCRPLTIPQGGDRGGEGDGCPLKKTSERATVSFKGQMLILIWGLLHIIYEKWKDTHRAI